MNLHDKIVCIIEEAVRQAAISYRDTPTSAPNDLQKAKCLQSRLSALLDLQAQVDAVVAAHRRESDTGAEKRGAR